NAFCLATTTPYHPLKAWTSQGYTAAREGYHGIYIVEASRDVRDISGSTFLLQFEIVDQRKAAVEKGYQVTVKLGSDVLLNTTYQTPGFYAEVLPSPHKRVTGSLTLELTN